MSFVNLIINGDFENGTLAPWLSGNAVINSTFSHTGRYSAQLAGGNVISYLVQFVQIEAGNNLRIFYSIAKIGALPSPPISVSVSY